LSTAVRAILIGGTSHVGKTRFSQRLAESLGWQTLSTDQLARFPGRPWGRKIPQDVQDYYNRVVGPDLLTDVIDHFQQNVWPIAEAIVRSRISNSFDRQVVLEGSAILPECVQTAGFEKARAIWFVAPREMIQERIYASSSYDSQAPDSQLLIDKFLDRTLKHNDQLVGELRSKNLFHVDVSDQAALTECFESLQRG